MTGKIKVIQDLIVVHEVSEEWVLKQAETTYYQEQLKAGHSEKFAKDVKEAWLTLMLALPPTKSSD